MKNTRIIESWDKVSLDSAASERMLSNIIKHNHRRSWVKYALPVAVCAAAALAVVVMVPGKGGSVKKEAGYPTKHLAGNYGTRVPGGLIIEGGLITEGTWEETGNAGKYIDLTYSNTKYTTCAVAISGSLKGSSLGDGHVTGQDGYRNEIHNMDVEVFSIVGVDPKCAVCVHFTEADNSKNGLDNVYAYMNTEYNPATLGDFIADLGLEKNLQAGLVYDCRSGKDNVVYEGLDNSKVLDLLKKSASVANTPDASKGRKVIDIEIRYLDTYGMNKSITLTDDGYLICNLLETEKCFAIGKDKVDEFVNYVTKNCDGYVYVYDVDEDGEQSVTEIPANLE